jgi:hypothetical protein
MVIGGNRDTGSCVSDFKLAILREGGLDISSTLIFVLADCRRFVVVQLVTMSSSADKFPLVPFVLGRCEHVLFSETRETPPRFPRTQRYYKKITFEG